MSLSKKMMNTQIIKENENIFRCPICLAQMGLVDNSRLVCAENHSFDLSKQGYVNLAPQAHATKYDKSLFSARKSIIESGFFNPMLDCVTNEIAKQIGSQSASTILDAGCGEGSHLDNILSSLQGYVVGVGIDLAKEGIMAAAKENPGSVWAVADLANCPFQDEQFDGIINILSPANYAEFTRLLKPNGLFIKVVPGSGYLKELRAVFYEEEKKQSETDPVERFSEHFELVTTEKVVYEFPLNSDLLQSLIRMTPLTWGTSSEKIAEAIRTDLSMITIEFNVIAGFKKDAH